MNAIPLAETKPAAAWLVLDIETGNAPEQDIERAIAAWKPPCNLKDEAKINGRREEAAARIRERAALLDASPILCVGVMAEGRPPIILSGMSEETTSIEGWAVLGCGDEAGMLRMLGTFLDAETDPETVLVGHNLRGFDLPKLRHAYIRHRLRLPEILKPKIGDEERAKTCDTMTLFRAFSMEHRDSLMVSLDTVAEALGIPRPKQHVAGAEIPRLHQEGRYSVILAYCAIDTMTCAKAYTLMAGLEGMT